MASEMTNPFDDLPPIDLELITKVDMSRSEVVNHPQDLASVPFANYAIRLIGPSTTIN